MLSKITLPGTSLNVSRLCFGTNMFGTAVDQGRANALLDQFVALGGNFIDTARSYGDWIPDAPKGASERAVGEWLQTRDRTDIVIATKGCFFDLKAMDYQKRVTPEHLMADLQESLGHLRVDTIDLYWLHMDDETQPVSTIIDALISHQRAGRIRWFGASNWSVSRIADAQAYARGIGHEGFVACQPFWGLAAPNREVAAASGYGPYYEDGYQALHADGLAMIPYSAQSRGFFSKLAVAGEAGLPDDLKAMYLTDTNRRRFEALQEIAKRRDVSLNTVALAYMTSQPHLTVPIIGASKPEQIVDSIAAARLALTTDELDRLRTGA